MSDKENHSRDDSANEFKQSWMQKAQLDPTAATRRMLTSFDDWRASRNWGTIAIGIFPLLLLLGVSGMVAWGKSVTSKRILSAYLEEAEKIAPIKEDGTGANEESEEESTDDSNSGSSNENTQEKEKQELTEYATLLFKRVLQKEQNNKRARYYVAARMGDRDILRARTMMAELAPSDTDGYPAAHAWRAADALQQRARGNADIKQSEIDHHLDIASRWGGTNPMLLLQRGSMLEKTGKVNEALSMYALAADRDPKYQLVLADAFRRFNQPTRLKETVQRAINYFSRHLNTEREGETDRLDVARAHLLLNEPDKAVGVLREGMIKRKNSDDYRRAISEVYRLSYLQSAKVSSTQFQANLVLLDKAIEIDAANPVLAEEIAKLTVVLGGNGQISDEVISSLTQQLAAGSSPLVIHVLMGNLKLIQGKGEEARKHWEIALQINERFVPPLRSLALWLVSKEQPEPEAALELIDRAMEISDNAPGIMDARADILRALERYDEAASLYEQTLVKTPLALETRAKLVEVYTALNQDDRAAREQATLNDLRDRVAKYNDQLRKQAQGNAPVDSNTTSLAEELGDKTPATQTPPEKVNIAPGSATENLNDLINEFNQPVADESNQPPASDDESSTDVDAQ